MHKSIFAIAIAGFGLSLGGCATVVNGTHQDLALSTIPEGSTATVTDGEHCTTPCKLKLKRKYSVRVDFAQAGYKPAYVLVRSKGGGATVGNILAGGIVGVLVDSGNGSNNFLSPNPVKVRLAATGAADEPALIAKDGKEQPLAAYNDSVRGDVAPQLGASASGLAPAAEPAPATPPAPAPTPAPATSN